MNTGQLMAQRLIAANQSMEIINNIKDLKLFITTLKTKHMKIGFVPTMGFLHEGHLSLMKKARADNNFLAISIFVNPIQFGTGEDYAEYPRDMERDIELAGATDCGLIFAPPVREMYPTGYSTFVEVENLAGTLCGISRPDHFRGVTTVVTKLFNLVCPDRAYFGQKDAQQAIILRRMVKDLNMNPEVVILPTIREIDGLAMSSRNKYLGIEERKEAALIYKSLTETEELIKKGITDPKELIYNIKAILTYAKTGIVDYIEIVDLEKLQPVEKITGRCLVAIAMKFGITRLIDNIIVEAE